jgi:hypothetical protein
MFISETDGERGADSAHCGLISGNDKWTINVVYDVE